MPDAASTSCDTVPDGLTQVIAAAGLIPSFFAKSLFVLMASCFSMVKPFSKLRTSFAIFSLSRIPVKETPNRASSSQFFFHSLERYGKFVKDAWNVPRIVARRTLRARSSAVSVALTTTSVRLQNSRSRRMISEHGFVPNS